MFHLPQQPFDLQVFYCAGAENQYGGYQAWSRPPGAKFVYLYCIGPGGGGGGGSSGGAVNRGGGGGGSSGGVATAMAPAVMLPATMFVVVGRGGGGGAADTDGSAGLLATGIYSWIKDPGAVPTGAQALLHALPGNGGIKGTTSGGGAAGTAVAAFYDHGQRIAIYRATGGAAGTAGGFNGIGGGRTFATDWWATVEGGCGGGGPSGAGSQNGGSLWGTGLPDLVGGQASGDINGRHGRWSWSPPYGLGGTGGAGVYNATGGIGGNGAYGCGGGGGGGGNTGGAGGRGGDGLVMIVSTF